MARTAREVTCSGEEERILNNIASSRTASFSEVLRAKIILYCLQGMPLSHIAKKLDVSLTMVTRWRNRFIESGSKGLVDLHRKGRPSVYTEKFREDVLLIFQIFTKQYLAKLLHCMAWNYQAAKQKTFGSTGDCGQWNFLKAV